MALLPSPRGATPYVLTDPPEEGAGFAPSTRGTVPYVLTDPPMPDMLNLRIWDGGTLRTPRGIAAWDGIALAATQ